MSSFGIHNDDSFKGYHSDLSKVIGLCNESKDLMVGLYHFEKNAFIACNEKLRNFIGKCYPQLKRDGWNYWFTLLNSEERQRLKIRFSELLATPYSSSPMVFRYHLSLNGCSKYLRHEIILLRTNQYSVAVNFFFDLSEKQRIERFFKEQRSKKNRHFSYYPSIREKQVLQLIADGHSTKEIAHMLFISNHTAVSHRKNLIEKFKVKNTAQLIKRASKIMDL